jgi:hypothetical protein
MFEIEIVEKMKTHIYVNFFFSKIAPFMRMLKNTVEPDRPQVTV